MIGLKKEQQRKKLCLNLSLAEARRIRDMNIKDDPSNNFAFPTFVEFREFGNLRRGFMVPDRGFTKQLHILDPELEIAWDWGTSKWEIWRFPRNGDVPFHIMTVQTKDRTYRELGADVLLKLQAGDPIRFTKKQLIDYLDEIDRQDRRRKAEEFKTKLMDLALDSFINIHCKIIQVPKEYSVGRTVSCQI